MKIKQDSGLVLNISDTFNNMKNHRFCIKGSTYEIRIANYIIADLFRMDPATSRGAKMIREYDSDIAIDTLLTMYQNRYIAV